MKTTLRNIPGVIYRGVTQYSPTRGVALILGLGLLIWGLWVVFPGTSFTSPVYTYMLELAKEAVWGAMFAFAGITTLVGVWIKDIEWIRRGSFLGFLLWGLVAGLGLVAEPSGPVVVTRLIIALMHAWIYMQVKIHPQLISGEVTIPDLTEYTTHRKNGV